MLIIIIIVLNYSLFFPFCVFDGHILVYVSQSI